MLRSPDLAVGVLTGFGITGYTMAMSYVIQRLGADGAGELALT